MEPDLINEFVPGDEQLQGIAPAYNAMVNENLLAPQENIPIKEMATNAAKNIATNYALKKIGIDGLRRNVLGSVIGGGLASINPIALFTMGSTLPNPVKGIAGYLRNKRAQKEYQRSENMLEAKILSNIMAQQAANMQGTPEGNRDSGMGGGSIPTKTTPAKSMSVGNPYSGGAGGIHSGYK